MNRVAGLIAREILRAEKNVFTFRLLATLASYAGITYWLNSIRQSAALWLVWCMIGIQLFLYLTTFVLCSLRLRQCRRQAWWIWFPLLLSRVNDWEVVLIPLTAIITLILSERNSNISPERLHLLPTEGDDSGAGPSRQPTAEGASNVADRKRDVKELARLRHEPELLENPETIYAGSMPFLVEFANSRMDHATFV